MPSPIYNTTDSQSGRITTESHSVGTTKGTNAYPHAGMTAKYEEIDSMGSKAANVKEFPSQSAGLKFGGDHDTIDPMD